MYRRQQIRRLGLASCLFVACQSNTHEDAQRATPTPRSAATDTTHVVTLAHPTAVHPLGTDPGRSDKFVQVVVEDVVNPQRHALLFNVSYRSSTDETVPLGTFGLYPPDQPGTFLVPTRGRLRADGDILVTLVVLDSIATADPIQATLSSINLRPE